MSGVQRHDVAVVGAGVVGAALALALARERFEVAIVEPREPARFDASAAHDLRVYAVSPASVALLERLGVWDAVRAARACPYAHMRVWERDERDELHFDAPLVGTRELGFIVEDTVLRSVLWNALAAEPRIARVCPGSVTGFEAAATASTRTSVPRARLGLASGGALEPRLVVAADGVASPLRALAGIESETQSYGARAIVANVRTRKPHEHTAWQRFTPDGPLAFLPLCDGGSSIVWSVRDARADTLLALDDAHFRAALTDAFGSRLGAVESSSARIAFPLRLQLAKRYAAQRVALVGDSAHAVHPLAGQGLNLGLLDASALAETLAGANAAGEDFGSAGVLERYQRWRLSDNAIAARTFDLLDGLFRSDFPLLPALRRFGMGALDRFAPLKRELALHASGFAGRVPALSRRPSA